MRTGTHNGRSCMLGAQSKENVVMAGGLVLSQDDETQIHSTHPVAQFVVVWFIFARDSVCCKRAYAIAIPSVHPSVCLSVCPHTGDSCKNG